MSGAEKPPAGAPPDRGGPRGGGETGARGRARTPTRAGAAVGRRRRSRSQEQADRPRRRRGDRPAEEGGHHLQGPLPVPLGEDPELHRHARPRELALLRLRRGRRHLQLRHAPRRPRLPGGAAHPRQPRRRRDRRADLARGRPPQAPPRRGRVGLRLLPRGPDEERDRRARPGLPARARLHATRRSSGPTSAGRRPTGTPWAGRWRGAARSGRPSWSRWASPRLRKGGNGAYDRFRARVIFPIRDATGNATGLGGRILAGEDGADPEGPKYLNSPATPLFDKSRTLYLLDRAKAPDPQDRHRRHRRGLHRRPDGPPGRLHERGRQPRAPR